MPAPFPKYREFLWQRWQEWPVNASANEALVFLRALAEHLTPDACDEPRLRQVLMDWNEHPGILKLRSTPSTWQELEALEHHLRQTWEEWQETTAGSSPLKLHLKHLQALRKEGGLHRHSNLEAVCADDHSLWLGEKLPLQPRVALRDVPTLRLRPPRTYALPLSLRNPVSEQPLPPEPTAEDLPLIWEHLDRLEKPFRSSGQDLLTFILAQVGESDELETEVQELFFRLVSRWNSWLRIEAATISWGGRRWAMVWPRGGDSA